MLVLERKLFEVITIGDDITLTVVEIAGDKVKLGIDAPKDVPVHRKEVYEAIRKHDTGEERCRWRKNESSCLNWRCWSA